mgnify:CR=1 FL=1
MSTLFVVRLILCIVITILLYYSYSMEKERKKKENDTIGTLLGITLVNNRYKVSDSTYIRSLSSYRSLPFQFFFSFLFLFFYFVNVSFICLTITTIYHIRVFQDIFFPCKIYYNSFLNTCSQ